MSLRVYKKDFHPKRKKVATFISYMSFVGGSLLLFWAIYPILSFELYSRLFFRQTITTPVPSTQIATAIRMSQSIDTNIYAYAGNVQDFTHASEWFPLTRTIDAKGDISATNPPPVQQQVSEIPSVISNTGSVVTQTGLIKEYSLTIPRLNIQNALVEVGGEDLSKSLIHFLPVSFPGENGNVVLFGHSTLPQLYDTRDYRSIFTYLPSLEKGDRVMAEVANTSYEYEVYDMFVVKPDQISVLDQQYDASYLTLITCVPPGTYWNRLVVKAKLVRQPTAL
jgi:sortase A